MNDTAEPDGLILILLVYGAYPRLSREDKPTPSNTARARAIERAMDDVRRSNAKIAIAEAMRTTRGPDVAAVLGLPLNAKVLVWREKPKSWTGPWRIVAREGYICKIDFDGRIIDMRITSVKPYKEIDEKKELPEDTPSNGNSSIRPTQEVNSIRGSLDARSSDARALNAQMPGSLDAQPSDARALDAQMLGGLDARSLDARTLDARTSDARQQMPGSPLRPPKRASPMVEIPAPRINRDEYRTFSDEAFLQEVYLADFATRTFLTEKEERDRELSIRLRANRVITTPGPPFH